MHVIRLDLTAPDELARLERESKALHGLSHPNILTILDFGTQDGFAYQVEELLQGETLRERLKGGSNSPEAGAFPGDSTAESLVATLKMDPPDLSLATQGVSPGLRRLVCHCLEKDPEQRFRSVRDLAFDLAPLSNVSDARRGPGVGSPGSSSGLVGEGRRGQLL